MGRGIRTRERIEAAAIKLFAANGFDRTSMREISAAVGVTEAALYRHFSGKEELGREVFLGRYAALARELREKSAEHQRLEPSLVAMTAVLFEHLERDPAVLCFLLQSQHRFLEDVPDGQTNVVDVITDCIREKSPAPHLSELFVDLVTAMVVGLVLQPAVTAMYGRLPSDLSDCRSTIERAVVQVASMEMEGKENG